MSAADDVYENIKKDIEAITSRLSKFITGGDSGYEDFCVEVTDNIEDVYLDMIMIKRKLRH